VPVCYGMQGNLLFGLLLDAVIIVLLLVVLEFL
jgi:hypothetical protein